MITEHLLAANLLHMGDLQKTVPVVGETAVFRKLLGCVEDLRQTAAFVEDFGGPT